VRWIHISEQADVARYLKGGELLLTTGMSLTGRTDLQRDFIRELAEAGVAGVMVRLGEALPTLTPAMVEEARRTGLPLIALHHRIGFVEVTEQVHAEIISRQVALLRKGEELRVDFTDLVLGGSDVRRILTRLAQILRAPVVLEDAAHQIVALAPGPLDPSELLATWELHSRQPHEETAEQGTSRVRIQRGGTRCAWIPIDLRGQPWGRVHALETGLEFDDMAHVAIDHAASSVGLSLLAGHDSRVPGDHARATLLAELRDNRLRAPEHLFMRARSLGVDLEGTEVVGIDVRVHGLAELARAEGLTGRERDALMDEVLAQVRTMLSQHDLTALTGFHGEEVLGLIIDDKGQGIRKRFEHIGENLHLWVARQWDGRLVPVIGVSGSFSAVAARQAIRLASEAAEIGARLGTRASVYHIADLSLYRLLAIAAEGYQLSHYVEGELGPLLDYDAQMNASLVDTLRCLIAHSGHVTPTAQALYVDRRTLYHRLTLMRRLLGRDVRSADDQLRLGVALKGLELLEHRRRA
jgi:purine catabolism regulator